MKTRYYVDAKYAYNVFGAHKRYRVRLLKETSTDLQVIDTWDYPMGVFPVEAKIGQGRAEKRIRKLRDTYQAELL